VCRAFSTPQVGTTQQTRLGGVEGGGAAVAGPVTGFIQLGGAGAGGSVGDALELAVAGQDHAAVGNQPKDCQQRQGDDHGQDQNLSVLGRLAGGCAGMGAGGGHRLLCGSMGS
jgi:hypothetical protein